MTRAPHGRTAPHRTRRAARLAGVLAGTMALALPVAPAAQAAPEQSSPGTFAGDFELPQRWNDDYAPGARCATPGHNGIYVTAQRRWFKQTDAASVANRNDHPVPVEQTVTTKRTQTTEVSANAKGEGELAKYMTNAFGFSYVHQVYWRLNQVVGPYELPAGKQGRLVWGFTVLDTQNQDVRCGEDLVWHPVGAPYSASVPEARYSELRIDTPDYL